MKVDALNRRSKLAPPQPLRTALEITDRDMAIFEAIDRHGQLPTSYLFQLTKSAGRDFSAFRDRITDLYNGYCDHPEHRLKGFVDCAHMCRPKSFLARDPAQTRTYRALSQQCVYNLTPLSRLLLYERGGGRRFAVARNDPFLHQLFGACLSASFNLRSHRFIPGDEILQHPKCPQSTRDEPNPYRIPVGLADIGSIAPDNLFGLQYAGGGFRFFAVEIDRNTEDIDPDARRKVKSSIAGKIKAYASILSSRTYEKRFGIPNLTILFATTSVAHMRGMIAYVASAMAPQWHRKFLFQVHQGFGTEDWRVPRETLDVFGPWLSVYGAVDLSGIAQGLPMSVNRAIEGFS
jgi:hypothetical protein